MGPKPNTLPVEDENEVLQAVVLADSFNKRFRPLTKHRPRCLLPICNAPLLDWTFESLALAGVQEVFVICRSHAEQVKTAIQDSRWSKPGSAMKIVPIMTAKETFSAGDAMRDIYTRGLVTGDFVLVMGDLVSNIRIDEVVRVHKERRKTNKDAIMTMVVCESGVNHRTRSKGDSSVFVLDAETSECLHYEPVLGYPRKRQVTIPREILEAHPEIEIRNDLIDCSIDVCSVEVPSLFQDNFDYEDIRRDFVHGILTSDLLMKNIHCYVAKEGYAARVKDTKSYATISKDILSRWSFPLVPDDNHPSGHVYQHRRGNRYVPRDNSVTLARTSKIGNNTMIGSFTQIADDTLILSSVIGQSCRVGAATSIQDSYIFDSTVVGAGCTIEESIIGANVTIKDGSFIPRGSLIGDGVVLGPNAHLQPLDRLSKPEDDAVSEDEDQDDDSELEDWTPPADSALGSEAKAVLWPRVQVAEEESESDDDEDDDGQVENPQNLRFMRLGDQVPPDSVPSDSEASDSESHDDESDEETDSESATSLDIPSSASVAETEFRMEVKLSLERAFAEGHSVDNAAVELKTLRMASNVPLSRVRESVVAAIVDRIKSVDGAAAQRVEISQVIDRWGSLIDKIGGVDPIETISILQAHCASSRLNLFGHILGALYQADLVGVDDVQKWHNLPASRGSGLHAASMRKCWEIGGALLEHLTEQDSDEEEEEEDEDDDDEEDESEKGSAAGPTAGPGTAPAPEDDETESEEGSETAADSVQAAGPAAGPRTASDEETESEEDSDADADVVPAAGPAGPAAGSRAAPENEETELEDDSDADADVVPAGSQTAGPAAVLTEGSEDEETESEEGLEVGADAVPAASARVAGPTSRSDDEDETESEESSEVEADAVPAVGPSATPRAGAETSLAAGPTVNVAPKQDERPEVGPGVGARTGPDTAQPQRPGSEGGSEESESDDEDEESD